MKPTSLNRSPVAITSLPLLFLTFSPFLTSAQTEAAISPTTPFTANSSSSPTPSSTPSVACNNSPLLCGRRYDDITHMGAHDASFLRDASTSNSVAGNQHFNATVALSAGIRLLTAQVHAAAAASSSSSSTDPTVLRLCHSYCSILDAGPLVDWLSAIKSWLDANENDVVTLILVNSDDQPRSAFGSAFDSAGISSYGFVPAPPPEKENDSKNDNNDNDDDDNNNDRRWPTLQEMIDSNKRLVSFVASIDTDSSSSSSSSSSASSSSSSSSSSDYYPFLLPQFKYVFETPYNVTDPAQFKCLLDRPASAGTASDAITKRGLLPLVNHFRYISLGGGGSGAVQIPDAGNVDITNDPGTGTANTSTTNTAGSTTTGTTAAAGAGTGSGSGSEEEGKLGEHLERCKREWDRLPVFALVDFFERGPAIEAADLMNGISAGKGQIVGRVAPTRSGSANCAAVGNPGSGVVMVALVWIFGVGLGLL